MRRLRARATFRVGALAAAVALAAAACSGSGGHAATSRTASTSTHQPTAQQLAPYSGWGPYPVGVLRVALPQDGNRRVVVWYPAEASAASLPYETFDLASLLSPALQAKIPASLRRRVQYPIHDHPGATPVPRPKAGFPIVLFSHGYAGFPEQSADLVTHLASWGFVVAAPDHVERSLDGILGTAAQGVPVRTDEQVLSDTLDLVEQMSKRSTDPGPGRVDPSKVAVIGHSAGAEAAYRLPGLDRRIKAFVSYAVSLDDGPSPSTTVPTRVPEVPGMVMTGTNDTVIPASQSEGVYAGMRAPKVLVTIPRSGHLVFSDICLMGKAQGGLAHIAHVAGIPVPPDLLKLAVDGCDARSLDVRKAFPAVDDLSVAFLRAALGIDPTPVGLDGSVSAAFPGIGIRVRAVGTP